MYTISISEIEEGHTESIEIWVAGHRRLTISLNKHNQAIQMPIQADTSQMSFNKGSFYMRTKDFG